MFDIALQKLTALLALMPFTAATWAVILAILFFVWLFSKAQRDPKSLVDWEHLILDETTNRASPYKVGFLLGAMVGTWIVIKLTDSDKLSFDILGLYLTYLLGGSGVHTFLANRAATQQQQTRQSTFMSDAGFQNNMYTPTPYASVQMPEPTDPRLDPRQQPQFTAAQQMVPANPLDQRVS